jgi:hypothetical protein
MRVTIWAALLICANVLRLRTQNPPLPSLSARLLLKSVPLRRRSTSSGGSKRSTASKSGRESKVTWRRSSSRRAISSMRVPRSIASKRICSKPRSSKPKVPWRRAKRNTSWR